MLGMLLMLAGCTGQGDPCVTDGDCFRGEACINGFCGAPNTEVENNVSMDAGDNNTTDDADGQTPNNANNQPDGDAGNPGPDGGDEGDAGSMGACFGDPFGVCEDDENPSNNSFPGAAFDPMTRGCQPSGFVPLDLTISGRQCPLDPEDQYYLTIVECDEDEPGMIIELTLDIKDECDADSIFFDVESIGTSCADPDPESDVQIQCETLATGERKITTIWPGMSSPRVGSIRWSIQTPDRNDVQFDYDLRAVVREP